MASQAGRIGAAFCILFMAEAAIGQPAPRVKDDKKLEARFAADVKPFLERYCFSCHAGQTPAAALNLTKHSLAGGARHWEVVLERLEALEMPPEKAKVKPTPKERAAVVGWIRDLHEQEATRNAGDPGIVLARRLSNAEFDYTIHDLTGTDIRPTREFPVDPANVEGFDNTGDSLSMSPALFKKYLGAARLVADHVLLKPHGFEFAPHPVVAETDCDKLGVKRIVDFYERNKVDYADYFLAAWKYRHRAKLGQPDADLNRIAKEAGLSPKYLALVWFALTEGETDAGPLAATRKLWRELPDKDARIACEKMRDFVLLARPLLKPTIAKLQVSGISAGSQPMVLWRNRELASRHRSYNGDLYADMLMLNTKLKSATPELVKLLPTSSKDEKSDARLLKDVERFASVFPFAFVVVDRGPYFDPKAGGKGRPLTAGFHLMQGHFRDDGPLCELILDDARKREIDALWLELNFTTLAPMRQYRDFIFFERAEPPRFMFEAEFDFARSEDKDCSSEAKMARLAKLYLAKAKKHKASDEALKAISKYFADMSAEIRMVERARLDAEKSHLDALVKFAERAYRRPLKTAEGEGIRAFYQTLRKKDDLSHDDALRDSLVTILLSPHFLYRVDLAGPGTAPQPLSDYALASRLSYFLWSSMPDDALLADAAAGRLRDPKVLKAQARRMVRDPRVRRLATEFAGNWLDFRRFEEHNAVDRQRFPSFTNELRQAMFEEPIRYVMDIAQRDRSVLDLVYGKDTFVNRPLAKHYGITLEKSAPDWVHIEDADRHGRGGLLPMAVFLTKNAPGLRTSPVKRGYWVVRRVLGERIPAPPPTVPELPADEAKLGELTLPQVLARHRADKSCAGCHRRFDAVGLVFEDFGPIGERRTKDLGGRPVATEATFPDGKDRAGIAGLRNYLKQKRQDDFVDNLSKKLFSYAVGRSVLPSDKKLLDEMRTKLIADNYAFGSLLESIVTSPQFLNKRGRDDVRD